MSLTDLWQAKAATYEDEMEQLERETFQFATGTVSGIEECIADFTDATKPRAPKAEWFGTGLGQWDSWWIEGWGVLHETEIDDDILTGCNEQGSYIEMYYDAKWNVLPVAREGYPAPVGWQVVGGKS